MTGFKQFLAERIVSIGLDTSQEIFRKQYREQIFQILLRSYSNDEVGGYGKLKPGSEEEKRAIYNDIDSCIIKASVRNKSITSVALYKNQHGRKCIASGTDGTKQGIKDFKQNKIEDLQQQRAWAEVSGKPEKIMRAMGAPVVPSEKAQEILGKDVTVIDNEYYSRIMTSGDSAVKVILGYPK